MPIPLLIPLTLLITIVMSMLGRVVTCPHHPHPHPCPCCHCCCSHGTGHVLHLVAVVVVDGWWWAPHCAAGI